MIPDVFPQLPNLDNERADFFMIHANYIPLMLLPLLSLSPPLSSFLMSLSSTLLFLSGAVLSWSACVRGALWDGSELLYGSKELFWNFKWNLIISKEQKWSFFHKKAGPFKVLTFLLVCFGSCKWIFPLCEPNKQQSRQFLALVISGLRIVCSGTIDQTPAQS